MSLLSLIGQNNPWQPPSAQTLPEIAPGAPAAGGMGAPSQYKGLSGFVDRFLHPNNPIGQLGKYISQASGGTFGGVYNAVDQDVQDQQKQQMSRQNYALALAKANLDAAGPEHYWETNDGSLGAVGGKYGNSPQVLYKDPTAKTGMFAVKNADGTQTLYPTINGVPQGLPGMASPAPAAGADLPTVEDGYRYTPGPGGKGNQANWKPIGGAISGSPGFQPSAVMDSLINVESAGRPGVLGPMTKYGQAQGLTQMLSGTAQDMARKLGIGWRPDLMTGKSEAAANYQRVLGQAYLQQGYDVTGNMGDALKYYHGGPDRRQWGPKTRAYSAKVMAGVR